VPFAAPAAITGLHYQMKVGRVSLRLSLWSSVPDRVHNPVAPVRNCGRRRTLDYRPLIGHPPADGFERLDFNHQSNVGHDRTKTTIEIVVRWSAMGKQKGETHETT
jgi:hypothetical protein